MKRSEKPKNPGVEGRWRCLTTETGLNKDDGITFGRPNRFGKLAVLDWVSHDVRLKGGIVNKVKDWDPIISVPEVTSSQKGSSESDRLPSPCIQISSPKFPTWLPALFSGLSGELIAEA